MPHRLLFTIVPVIAGIVTARGCCSVRGDLGSLADHAQACGFRAERFAVRLGVSSRSLRRTFQQKFGISLKNWMLQVRMVEILKRLHGRETLHEIALAVGFSHGKELSRVFRKVQSVTPTAYRIRERAALLIKDREQGTGRHDC